MAYVRKQKSKAAPLVPEMIVGNGKWVKGILSESEGVDAVTDVRGGGTAKNPHKFLLHPLMFDIESESIHTPEQREDVEKTQEKLRRRAYSRIRFAPQRDKYAGKISSFSAMVLDELRIDELEHRTFDEGEAFNVTAFTVYVGPLTAAKLGSDTYSLEQWAGADTIGQALTYALTDKRAISAFYLLAHRDKSNPIAQVFKEQEEKLNELTTPISIQMARQYFAEWYEWKEKCQPVLDSILSELTAKPTQIKVVELGKKLDALLDLKSEDNEGKGKGEGEDGEESNPLSRSTQRLVQNYFNINYKYEASEEYYTPGAYGTIWGPVEWVSPTLTVDCKPPNKKKDKAPRRKTSDMGYVPSRMERLVVDQRIFSPKLRKKAETPVTILVDCSGSMYPDYAAIGHLMDKAPSTQVIFYSGHRSRVQSVPGRAFIAGKNGRRIDEREAEKLFENYGNNDIDLPMLQWAVTQPGKVVWISDGKSYSKPQRDKRGYLGEGYEGIKECAAFIKHHNIPMYRRLEHYIQEEGIDVGDSKRE